MSLLSKELLLLEARIELQKRAWPSRAFLQFIRKYDIDQQAISRFIGGFGVTTIADCGADRFEFSNPEIGKETVEAFVFEALGEDGETVIDLVAIPVSDPTRCLSMFGQCGLLGLWEAMGPATYFMGTPLTVHCGVLQWFQAGCNGSAVVTPDVAAPQLVATPGRLAAENHTHGRELVALLKTVIDVNSKVVVRSTVRRAA